MPVAMAALDVAGQIRERSPADLAIFGEAAGRLVERFVQRDRGQALLARAVTDGSAEGIAWLITGAGQQRFRVSLWRQRGGERIRILAAFSACAATGVEAEAQGPPDSLREVLLRLGRDMRPPLGAVMGFAEMIRTAGAALRPEEAAGHASDIIAAAWRLMRIAEDLEAVSSSGEARLSLVPAEVDLARLVRRVARLAAPAAEAAGVAIDTGGLPGRGRAPLVLGDERTLWSVVESLIDNAVRHAGRGAEVRVGLAAPEGRQGLALEIADNGPGLEADALARLLEGAGAGRGIVLGRALARANGAELEFETAPGKGVTARLVFPPARCLDPV
jgi:signal transduction histidine kinase